VAPWIADHGRSTMLTLFDFAGSGNGYKVRLALHRLGMPYALVPVDILRGESRTPAFLALSPNGKVPVLRLADGTVLTESNAILWYLAEGTPLLPEGRLPRARVLEWMFFEQYSHEPAIAVARFIHHCLAADHPRRAELPGLEARGHTALGVMEGHLRDRAFLVGETASIADLALFAYTHVAGEGGFDLTAYPAVRGWLTRIAGQPGHVAITGAG
jgi:glutathione S-transferase